MRTPTVRTLCLALAALTAAFATVSCTPRRSTATPSAPPATSTPAATSAPAGGLPAGPGEQTTGTAVHPASAPVSAYFVSAEKVAPCARTASMPALARGAMLALLEGPTAAERSAGYSTAIPAGTRLLSVSIHGDTATVDLSGEFDDGGGTLSMSLRAAQVIHTLTQFAGVKRVRFRMDGEPLELLGGEGIEIAEPQTRAMWEDHVPAVLIESPGAGAVVASPLTVRGTANVFEAVFTLDVVDPDGAVLASRVVHATSGTGTRGTFSASVPFTPWAAGTGHIVAKVASPKDGSWQTVVSVPIRTAP